MVQNRVIIISYGKWLNIIFQYLNSNLDVARIVIMDAFFLENKKVTIFKDKHTIATSYAFLEEVLNDVYYDYILVALPVYSEQENIVITDLKKWNIKKVFRVGAIYSSYLIYCASIMKYISKNASKYRVFITGISRMWRATDLESYKLPAVCCAYTSQDLYYDYLWAKKILSFANHNFKYAVIGVTEYSFQYDESIGSPEQFLMLPYYRLFKDVHNYHVTKDVF